MFRWFKHHYRMLTSPSYRCYVFMREMGETMQSGMNKAMRSVDDEHNR